MLPFGWQVLLALTICGLAVVDFRSFRLPNWFTLPLLALGWIWHALADDGAGLAWSLKGSAISMAPLLWFYFRGKMGAGDVKLMAAIGAWLGGWTGLHVLVVSGLAGVVCDLACRWRRAGSATVAPLSDNDQQLAGDVETALRDPFLKRRWIPFSIPIALGVVVLVLFPGLQREVSRSVPPTTEPQGSELHQESR